jgi:hypothetical protein
MGSVNQNLNEESALRLRSRFTAFKMGTTAFLLATAAAKAYTAFFVAGTSSAWFVPALVGGVSALAVGIVCLRGKPRAFRAAAVVAVLTIVLDAVASGGITPTGAIIFVPEIFVLAFAGLSLKQLKSLREAGQ